MACMALPGASRRVQDKEKKKRLLEIIIIPWWESEVFSLAALPVQKWLKRKRKKKREKANRSAVAAKKIYPWKAVVVLVHRQRKGSKRRARVPVESRKNVRRCLREEGIRPEFRGSVASLWIFIEKEAKRGRGSPVEMSESGRYLTLGSSDEWKALLRHW